MLLWITETPDLLLEADNLLIRTPNQITAINPQDAMLVVIDIQQPQSGLMSWAKDRKRATLWWQPTVEFPDTHCAVLATDYSCAEFIRGLNHIYQQPLFFGFNENELEEMLCKYSCLRVFNLPCKSGELVSDQTWDVGYRILEGSDRSLDDIEQSGNIIRERFNIKTLYFILPSGMGINMLMAFNLEN